jgi:hypothetical protein
VSKESKIKKREQKIKSNSASQSKPRPPLTPEQKAAIVRDRLANRPVIVFRYPNGKYNTRFIFMLALLIVALIVAMYFFSR